MNDINKMRAGFEEKIRLAEMENDFENRYGIKVGVFNMGDYDMVHIECDNETAKRLLNELEADKEWAIDHERDSKHMYKYRLCSIRRYSDQYSKLEIEFINKDVKYWIDLPIDGNELLMPFFRRTRRTITETELSTWHPVNNQGTLDRDMQIPQMSFNSQNVKRYYGGDQLLVDGEEIERIINAIKTT